MRYEVEFVRCLSALLVIVLVGTVAAEASAYSISMVGNNVVRWNATNIPYKIQEDGSDDINNGSDFQKVKDAFDDWASTGCTAITFNYLGTTPNKAITSVGEPGNGVNEIAWIEGSAWTYGSYVLGVTSPLINWQGQILEADIGFNGRQHEWSTSGTPSWNSSVQDVLNIAIHENGHFFGLQHVLDYNNFDPPTMAPVADPNLKTASLTDDDRFGACYLYPASGSHSCSSHSDCPDVVDNNVNNGEEYYSKYGQCLGGTCDLGFTEPPPSCGTAQLGESCFSDEQCDCTLYCQDTGFEQICSKQCSTLTDDCPLGFSCSPYTLGGTDGACLPVPCREAGDVCSSAEACCSELCVGISPDAGYFCRDECDTGNPVCPEGLQCVTVDPATQLGACIPEKLKIGDTCTGDAECGAGYCRSITGEPGSYFCTDECASDSDCPCSMRCLTNQEPPLCIPGVNSACQPPDTGDTTQTGSDGASGQDTIPILGSGTQSSSGCRSGTSSGGTWFWLILCLSFGSLIFRGLRGNILESDDDLR